MGEYMGSPHLTMVLSGRLALVTGGGRGIGRAVCQVLARDNAKVVVTDLSMESCQETMESLRPDDHFSVASDVSQAGSANDCFKQILDKYKRAPDIVVNSAGITKDGFLLRMKEEDFDSPCLCGGRARVQPVRQGGEGLPWRSEAQDPLCRWLPAQVPLRQDWHLQAKVEEVRRQVRASEAVRDRETPLPVDHQEQEPPMGQIDISLCWTRHNIGSNRYHTLYAHRFSSEY